MNIVKKEFVGTCVDNPFKTASALQNIIIGAHCITRKSFLMNCNVPKDVKDLMLSYPHDFGYFRNGEVYYYTHSAIEYFYSLPRN